MRPAKCVARRGRAAAAERAARAGWRLVCRVGGQADSTPWNVLRRTFPTPPMLGLQLMAPMEVVGLGVTSSTRAPRRAAAAAASQPARRDGKCRAVQGRPGSTSAAAELQPVAACCRAGRYNRRETFLCGGWRSRPAYATCACCWLRRSATLAHVLPVHLHGQRPRPQRRHPDHKT
jgi:hypothetical protein